MSRMRSFRVALAATLLLAVPAVAQQEEKVTGKRTTETQRTTTTKTTTTKPTVTPGQGTPGKTTPAKVKSSKVTPSRVRPARVIRNPDGTTTVIPPEIIPPQIEGPEVTPPTVRPPIIRLPEVSAPQVEVRSNDEVTVFTIGADVLFDFDKDNIRPDADAALRQISAAIAKRYPAAPLRVEGHTDAKGTDAYNQDLSQRRAASVKRWLMDKGGVSINRMGTRGYGESQPVAPNVRPDGSDDPAGRQQNRRVEIIVLKK